MPLNEKSLIDAYGRYLEIWKTEPEHERYADYGWEALPENLSVSWLPYREMLIEFSRSLANIVNQLGNYARRLRSWDKTLSVVEEDLRLELLFEFVDPIATISLTLPYAIQSRFLFAVAHLSHQANKARLGREWKDNLPDDRDITLKIAKKYARNWSSFDALEASISAIFSEQHQQNTDEFRHKFTHRVPTQVVLGHAGSVRRRKGVRGVVYEFGYRPPIDVKVLATELSEEFDRCLVAFQDFKKLVAEHTETIKNNNTLP